MFFFDFVLFHWIIWLCCHVASSVNKLNDWITCDVTLKSPTWANASRSSFAATVRHSLCYILCCCCTCVDRFSVHQECNSQCACSTSRKSYDPVCGSDDLTYFSACFAGCTDFVNDVRLTSTRPLNTFTLPAAISAFVPSSTEELSF